MDRNQALSYLGDVLLRLLAWNNFLCAKFINAPTHFELAGHECGIVWRLHVRLSLLPEFRLTGLQFGVLELNFGGLDSAIRLPRSFIVDEGVKIQDIERC